jgi:hypothetical protein
VSSREDNESATEVDVNNELACNVESKNKMAQPQHPDFILASVPSRDFVMFFLIKMQQL